MTTCIKCGRPVADRELFCEQCNKERLQEKELRFDDAPRPRASSGRAQKSAPKTQKSASYAAAKPTAHYQPQHAAAPAKPQKKTSGAHRGAIIALSVLCVALAAFCAWELSTRARANVAVRVREAELDTRAHTMDELQIELDAREEELQKANAQIEELQSQLDSAQALVDKAESSMNQSQYDLTAQQVELEQLQKKNETLSTEAEAMQETIQTLTEQNAILTKEQQASEKKLKFMDTYVVFVEDDGTGWYHSYDCPYFTQQSFWAYSRKLAEKNNYKPCPHCFG